MLRRCWLALIACWQLCLYGVWPVPALAQTNGKSSQGTAATQAESAAQQIARLRRSIQEDKELLEKLKQELNDPQSPYKRAEEIFQRVDAQREDLLRQLQAAKDAGDQQTVEALTQQLAEVERQWKLAKEAFEAELRNRRLVQERIAALTEKIKHDEEALRQLTGEASAEQTEQAPTQPATPSKTATPEATPGQVPVQPSPQPSPTQPTTTPPQQPAEGPSGQTGETAPPPQEKKAPLPGETSEELSKLEQRVQELQNALDLVSKRLATTERTLEQEREALRAARVRHTTAVQTLLELQQQLRDITRRRLGEVDPARVQALDRQIQQLSDQLQAAQETVQKSQEEVQQQERRVERLTEERRQLADEKARLERELAEAQAALEAEKRRAYWLGRLWQILGIKDWLIEHGPTIALAIIIAILALRLTRAIEKRIVDVALRATGAPADPFSVEERRNRARTLAAFFRHVAQLVIIAAAGMVILGEFGVRLDVLLGGAAITGLAAAFAGQNLLRDYFSGFVILFENQYGVNDVVKIGDVTGIVEQVTLRLTVLRSVDGTVHFIPNGQITTVSNMTHGWSRAYLDIEVSYKEDLDEVMAVLLELAREMRDDPVYGPLILEDPEMLGVDEFRQSGISIKFFLKTRPLKQWIVKRELQRRIKKRFDELGIEIPFPHRTVYHRLDEAEPQLRLLLAQLHKETNTPPQSDTSTTT